MLAFEKVCVRTKWMIIKVIHSFIHSFTCGFLMFSGGIERAINMKWIKGICELRGGSRTAATFKMEHFVLETVNYYRKVLHLGCCSIPRSASGTDTFVIIRLFTTKVGRRMKAPVVMSWVTWINYAGKLELWKRYKKTLKSKLNI